MPPSQRAGPGLTLALTSPQPRPDLALSLALSLALTLREQASDADVYRRAAEGTLTPERVIERAAQGTLVVGEGAPPQAAAH